MSCGLPQRAPPDELGEMQAILHRVMTMLISLSLVRNSGQLHTAVIKAWLNASFVTCKRSMRELLWGYSNEFIDIEYDLVYDLRDKPAVSILHAQRREKITEILTYRIYTKELINVNC